MPWVHFHVTQYGTVTPCCQAPWQEEQAFGNMNSQTLSQVWTGDKINTFRKSMLYGKVDERCQGCFKKEKAGFTSLRQITNKNYADKIPIVQQSAQNSENWTAPPVYFDIRFSNVCNLKCRMCGPWSSSSWFRDAAKLNMLGERRQAVAYAFDNAEKFFNEFEQLVNTLEEIYFAGGEPLVMNEHYRLLELLIKHNRTDVKLVYNTNFSSFHYRDTDVIALWKQFSRVNIAASLDASQQRGELLRKNLTWEDVLANRRLLLEQLPHIEFTVSATLNAYNLLHLPEFHLEWLQQKLISVEDLIPTLLIHPAELSISNLPKAFRQKALGIYSKHMAHISSLPYRNAEKREHMLQQFKSVITCLQNATGEGSAEGFRKSSTAMDALRNEKTIELFPELKELLEA